MFVVIMIGFARFLTKSPEEVAIALQSSIFSEEQINRQSLVTSTVNLFCRAALQPPGHASGREFLSGVIAELRIEIPQCVRGILQILGRKILPIAAYFSATHFK
jgi:hypothetical protein